MEDTESREVAELKEALEAQKQDYESKLLNMMLDHCVETALIRSGARCVKAAKAMIDPERIEIDHNKQVRGIEEQIQELKGSRETAFLFRDEVSSPAVPHEGADRKEPGELTYEGYCALYGNQ